MDPILNAIDKALKLKGLSDAAASKLAVGHPSLIKNFRMPRSGEKRYNLAGLEKLADVLDLELYFGPPRQLVSSTGIAVTSSSSPTFSPTKTIPMRGFASCSIQGWGRPQPAEVSVAMPEGLTDPDAFYVRAHGQSMIPDGISAGALCLISPRTEPKINDRVWIKEHSGKTSIKRLVSIDEKTITLRGWLPVENGSQKSFNEERVSEFVTEIYPVTAVFRGSPGKEGSKVTFVPDPKRSDAQMDSAEFEDQPVAQDNSDYHLIKLNDVQAAATNGTFKNDEGILSSLAFRKIWLQNHGINPANASLVHVKGDSMAPALADGSVVMIDHQKTEPQKRRMFAFREGFELFVKRLEKPDANTLIISADNPAYPSRVLVKAQMNAIHIIGEVVWAARDI